ncbi:GNAT family N-acetyltransferase [Alkalihalophilus pseudofirmus]|uniref:GNAT family N-acetyltransferase n=1 Tax=Alkalihalophilus pseudofirmus TaxID=79885 RepID=UPI00259BF018|nr:GNAT family N-acetyltransferase [Alkalihalophilus pseudofirmus]WEG15104.1 GNAT family N-acetyltransferase [Alkalihalophilus pseudofirmus]
MHQTNELELKLISDKGMEGFYSFHLPKDQEMYTSLPDNYKEVKEGQYRIGIYYKGEPVGFFLLHSTDRVKEYTSNPLSMLLTAFSITEDKQGKGYAKQAMLLLKTFISEEFPYYNEVVLAVNHKNLAAQSLYKKAGFYDTGSRKIGPIGEQYILQLKL